MDSTQLVAILLAVTWVVGGFVVAVFMKRAGRDFRLWLGLGVLLGPFAGLFAPASRTEARRGPYSTEHTYRSGDFDVLAGIDGSPESVAALRSAVGLVGDRISSLTLARVLDFEAAGSYSGMAAQAEACEELGRVSDAIDGQLVDIELLYGAPGRALAEFARDQGMELIVIGARGRGMTRALFGSVARDLVGRSEVPVLIGPASEPSGRTRLSNRQGQAERESGSEADPSAHRPDVSTVHASDRTGDIQTYAHAFPIR
jgi:nucleotide-binding universal stress UspA family protein